jgi:hypothetical protein
MKTLELALIGNGRIGLLVDGEATVVWGCYPAFDGDPMFCALLDTAPPGEARGLFAIEVADAVTYAQDYARNTAVLVTTVTDAAGGVVEITDCVPRFRQHGRVFQPVTLVRRVRRLAGNPRITVRLRPATGHGAEVPAVTIGSHHIRYVGAGTRCGSPRTRRSRRSARSAPSSSKTR